MAAAVEDRHMENLMAKWETENNYQEPDSDDDESEVEDLSYDSVLEKYRRTVHATDNSLDHIVVGTSDLDVAMDRFEKETGVRPLMVVSHKGLGTKSARVAFEQCAFLEIIAPDPAQGSFPLAERLANLPPDGQLVPMHYAIRNSKGHEEKNTTWKDLGLECDQVTMVAKDRGMPWQWHMFFMEGHDEEGLMPFFIDWGEAHHAAGRLPIVGKLADVKVQTTNTTIRTLLKGADGVAVSDDYDLFEFSFETINGKKTYSGSNLIGLSFPK